MERENLSDGELVERLEMGLRRMPERRRMIFLAVRFDGAGYAELAERTGLSVQQVERELAAALVQLRRAVDGGRPEPGWRHWLRLVCGRERR